MLHPSYTELMKVINGDSEEEKVISSRYSIETVRKTGCLGIPKHPYLYR